MGEGFCYDGGMPTIFIEIASYRDSELTKTIASALEQAAFANRLRFGIVNQVGPETAQQLDRYQHDKRFRIVTIPWQQSRGVGVARRKTDELYNGEDFYLQIDSHMRFEKDWDVRLVDQWQHCNDTRAILSAYPPAYKYNQAGQEQFIASKPNRLVVHDFYLGTIPTFFGMELPGTPVGPDLAAFASGGFQFGPGSVCQQVPYEPRICFIGEEIVHSLRLYSHGYNMYAPVDQVVSHLYIRSQNQPDVHHFWHDFTAQAALKQVYTAMNTRSYQVVAEYLTGQTAAWLGQQRSRQQYEDFAGVDFARQLVHAATYQVPPLPMARDGAWRQAAIAAVKQT